MSYSSDYLSLNWLSCFDIGIRLSTYLGMPPPISTPHLLNAVKQACSQVSSVLPPSFRALLTIRQVTASFTSHLLDLSDGGSHTAHFGLTQHFDKQLDDVKTDIATCWTPALEVDLQGAKLYLYATTLALPTASDAKETTVRSLHRETALQKGLLAAMAVITNTTALSLTSADSDCYLAGVLTFYPKQYFTTLFFATTFLFRLLLSSRTAMQQDRELALAGLMDAHKTFHSFPNDRDHVALLYISRHSSKYSASNLPLVANLLLPPSWS
ncbi:hypothetical protein LTR85_000382 [Meristemomyces frigidus]|nr:hypothetical protein LTR85_000382 [Meristemomyces frigidus]